MMRTRVWTSFAFATNRQPKTTIIATVEYRKEFSENTTGTKQQVLSSMNLEIRLNSNVLVDPPNGINKNKKRPKPARRNVI